VEKGGFMKLPASFELAGSSAIVSMPIAELTPKMLSADIQRLIDKEYFWNPAALLLAIGRADGC
jgi:hypothetical protein